MQRFNSRIHRVALLSVAPLALGAGSAAKAQTEPSSAEQGDQLSDALPTEEQDIVVTGSRIRRSATDTTMPMVMVDQQSIIDRGFTSAAESLNTLPSINRQLAQAPGSGGTAGSGIQAPALFGLGTGRTLTLINGRRTVTSSSGLGDAQVDSNIIPLGLLRRVEVVQGGAAAVYGSDAIAGVVNYILLDDFEGVEIDAQSSITSRGDFPNYSARLTAGTNFGGGRGNIAANLEWSKSDFLFFNSRETARDLPRQVANPANTSNSDGISATQNIVPRFWVFNPNGVIFRTPAPSAALLLNRQFAPDGSVVPFNIGQQFGVPFSVGGDGLPYYDFVPSLRTGIERITGNIIGRYDLTDNVRLSTELLYARTEGTDRGQPRNQSVLSSAASGAGAIAFTVNNPFLTPGAIAQLTALAPTFATGAPLFLSKIFNDLSFPTITTTETYRGVAALSGDLSVGARDFNWSLSGSWARVDGETSGRGVVPARFNNAVNAVRGSSGQPVCAINADAVSTNDDPGCVALNPFGDGNVSLAAQDYVLAPTGSSYRNEQVDLLATFGGDIVALPGGTARFSLTYEHRDESVEFSPFAGNRAGIFGAAPVLPQSGSYNTDEYAAELLLPLVGEDFQLPLVNSFELSAAYRYVDNSIAGSESVWNIGGLWEVVEGVTLRGSRSRNFRAPTLTQLFAPSNTAFASGNQDPCDADRISGGPNPTQRRASCLALFEANPNYGTGGPGGAAVGSSAATRLATFQNSGENFNTTLVTSGGNPNLRNEISDTWTYGVVLQPRFIPGLTVNLDRIEIDLQDGLSAFTTLNFAEACYDDPSPSAEVCNAFSRISAANAQSQAGSYATGTTTTFNAGVVRFRGETFNVNYILPLGGDYGRLEFDLAATHTSLLESSVTGTQFVRTDNTLSGGGFLSEAQPDWVGRFDVRYTNGPLRVTYQAYYLSSVLAAPNANVENSPNPRIPSNLTHSVSFNYQVNPQFSFRAGVDNLTDKAPSFATILYGDIIGRQFFAGARLRF